MRNFLLSFIDFFHLPFSRFVPKATFRYLFTGGSTALTGVIAYFIAYNFILRKEGWHTPFIYISGPIAALMLELCITFPLGFLLNKYLVFTQSNLRGRIQLVRYGSIVMINIFLNYILIKSMVELFHFYPTIAKFSTTVLVTIFSYFSQKNFSFGIKSAK